MAKLSNYDKSRFNSIFLVIQLLVHVREGELNLGSPYKEDKAMPLGHKALGILF